MSKTTYRRHIPVVIENGEYIPNSGAQAKVYGGTAGGGMAGGKTAAMEAHMRAWTAKNPGATIAVLSIDPDKCRVEKPAGSGKA